MVGIDLVEQVAQAGVGAEAIVGETGHPSRNHDGRDH